MNEIQAVSRWNTNADLIADVAKLHLDKDMLTLDATYGTGLWWRQWKPNVLISLDKRTNAMVRGDFCQLPFRPVFDLVAYDPPYKLNGRPDPSVDERYGVDERSSTDRRMQLIVDGLHGCIDVMNPWSLGSTLIVKVQDQVSGGKMRWQRIMVTNEATRRGLRLVDEFQKVGSREQPWGRSQDHARGRGSVLLVFKNQARQAAGTGVLMPPRDNT